jgi:hypothetical protein
MRHWLADYGRSLERIMNAAANNGMHPTHDTLLVIYLQRLVRASDAGR